jgi:hypothetical protein
MVAIYACSLLIVLASLAIGRAILVALGGPRPAWLSGATGFAALVILAPLLLHLPGRATTALIVVALATFACAWVAIRDLRTSSKAAPGLSGQPPGVPGETGSVSHGSAWLEGLITALVVALIAAIPFAIAGRTGVLGEGIYTNDHAAQLYWADWLQRGFGPEPSAVRFGYPTGPQSVAVLAAQATGTSLVSSFNGLLLAIPVLTALTALGGLARLPVVRRVAAAVVVGLPYLGASFLAQSAFKETAMALFVLAFALAMATRSGLAPREDEAAVAAAQLPRWRLLIGVGIVLGLATVFTFSVPGLAWFAIALPLWLILEALAGRSPVDWRAVRSGIAEHKVLIGVIVVVLIGAAVAAYSPAREFASKIADVQASAGRLSSPVFPGEALGIWPAGDFRIVRGEVPGSLLALAIGGVAVAFGAWVLLRRRQFALLSMLVTGGIVYVGTRLFAEIHVQAKALMVIAPLVLLIGLAALLAPRAENEQRATSNARWGFGVVVLVAAALSTLLALRDAPIGFDDRQQALEQLAEEADGHTLAFLGVDRFAGYYLRDTLMRAPAGYVPQEIKARPEKTWQQGLAVDFDTLAPGQLDKFQYVITTDASFASTPPSNFERVDSLGDYVLWTRTGETPRSRVLKAEGKVGDAFIFRPGADLNCGDLPQGRSGTAVVIDEPALASYTDWKQPLPPKHTAAGQGLGWEAPGEATTKLSLPRHGQYELSLQYHSQVPLEVVVGGEVVADLPPSLEGMYLSGAGRGAYWSAGVIEAGGVAPTEATVRAADPGGLAGALGAPRRVWLGDLAASPVSEPQTMPLDQACDRYVDHYSLERGGRG